MSKHNEELHTVPSLLELAEQLENKAAEEEARKQAQDKEEDRTVQQTGKGTQPEDANKNDQAPQPADEDTRRNDHAEQSTHGESDETSENPHLLARMLSRQTACLLVLHPLEERQKPLSFLPRLRLRRTRSPRLYVPLKSLLESGSFFSCSRFLHYWLLRYLGWCFLHLQSSRTRFCFY